MDQTEQGQQVRQDLRLPTGAGLQMREACSMDPITAARGARCLRAADCDSCTKKALADRSAVALFERCEPFNPRRYRARLKRMLVHIDGGPEDSKLCEQVAYHEYEGLELASSLSTLPLTGALAGFIQGRNERSRGRVSP